MKKWYQMIVKAIKVTKKYTDEEVEIQVKSTTFQKWEVENRPVKK